MELFQTIPSFWPKRSALNALAPLPACLPLIYIEFLCPLLENVLSAQCPSWPGCARPEAAPGTANRLSTPSSATRLEETYEVLEAIDNRDWDELPGELGDLLLQVLFYSEMAKEQGTFSIDDVLDRLSTKLVDRHPHVFGDVKADTPSEVLRNWEALKAEEKKKRAEAQGKTT